jgi:DNA-3-methyladenine glycosylase II
LVIKTLSDIHIKESIEFLSSLDTDWECLIKKVGPCHLKISSELSPYESLLKTIAYQQLHAKAAETIFKRFLSLFKGNFPKADELIKTDPIIIRRSGFSQKKTETLLLIAKASLNKIIPEEKEIMYLNDDEIIERLTSIKGVGVWTAQMLLIFHLGRLDVLPIHDLSIKKGFQTLKRLNTPPKPKLLLMTGEIWRPYRTIASWYLWRAN